MHARIPLSTSASGLAGRRRLDALALAALTALVVLLLSGCATTAGEPAGIDHGATVSALLPTQHPTEPPPSAAALAATAIPPTGAATAAAPPTIPPPPTYTPRPRPTYTPRPAPTRESEGGRQPAENFRARLLDGSELELSDTLGTPTLLAFWAPW